jgi:hypothetical protein
MRLTHTGRLRAQLLAGPPARDAAAVVERILCVQAQDLRGARLAIRARSTGLLASDVDRALTEARSLVVAYLNRGTLHLVRSEDYPWLQALLAPPLMSASTRRLAQVGVSPSAADRGVAAMERALAEDGPLTRAQLGRRIAAAGVPTAGQALIHVLRLGCVRGIAVRGPVVGREQAYVLVRDWLGEPAPVDRDAALAELGRRYLAGHAAGTDRDLARWAGLPLRDARAALAVAGSPRPARAEPPPPRLLGPFDPVLFGWTSREWVLGDRTDLVTVNGIFKAFALVRGRAAATWTTAGLQPFAPLSPEEEAALDAERAAVERFLSG